MKTVLKCKSLVCVAYDVTCLLTSFWLLPGYMCHLVPGIPWFSFGLVETGSQYIGSLGWPATLTRLALNSQRPTCLCLPSAEFKLYETTPDLLGWSLLLPCPDLEPPWKHISGNCAKHQVCFVFLFLFFEIGFFCVALAVLRLALWISWP
jgi:hypothetical protein